MPLQKLSKPGADFLKIETLKEHGSKWKITSKPVQENGKFGMQTKMQVVSIKDKFECTYSPNSTSNDYLIDKLGDEEADWIGQTFELEIGDNPVNGQKDSVLYVKGSQK